MKKFNIIKQRTQFWGRYIPIGSVTGCFTTRFTVKGKPCTRRVVYYIDDFVPYRRHVVDPFAEHKLYHNNYRINILNERTGKWYKTHTDCVSLWPLANFLTNQFAKNNIDPYEYKVEHYTTNRQMASICPKERKVQNEYNYKPSNKPLNTKDPGFDALPHRNVIPHWYEGNERPMYNRYSYKKNYHKDNGLKEPERLWCSHEHYKMYANK